MFISMGKAIDTCAPASLAFCQDRSDIPVMWMDQRLDGGVRVLRRVMDLRDVVHRRDAVIELGQAPEQLVDVHVLRPVHGGEGEQNEFEVGRAATRRVRLVVYQYPVGEEAAQRRL